jgi:hypothetical protein
MGGTAERLRQRARRRGDWIAAAVDRFEGDRDVAAAWLFGSEGRGEADELSDLEVIVAVADAAADRVLPHVGSATFAAFGDVLSCTDVAERAPEGGRAFVVAYPAPVEPIRVQWWFQRAGLLRLGSDARVLVDKVGMSVAEPPLSTSSMLWGGADAAKTGGGGGGSGRPSTSRRVDRLQERVAWFWSTAPSVAKWLARGWTDRAEPDVERMVGVVEEATAFLNRQPPERSVDPDGPIRPLSRLRAVMVELASLSDALAAAGVELPSTDRAYGWLELAEDLEAERWEPNSPN